MKTKTKTKTKTKNRFIKKKKKEKKKKEPVELVSPLFVNKPLKPGFLKIFTILVSRCPIIYWRSVQKELQKE